MGYDALKELVGTIIKNLRESKEMTQESLCELIDINQGNLSNIENGKNFPSFETICALIEVLNIEPNEFFGFLKYNTNTKDATDVEFLEHYKILPKSVKLILLDVVKHIK